MKTPKEEKETAAGIALSRADSIGLAKDIFKVLCLSPSHYSLGKVADKLEAIFVMYHLERCKKCILRCDNDGGDYTCYREPDSGRGQHIAMVEELGSR